MKKVIFIKGTKSILHKLSPRKCTMMKTIHILNNELSHGICKQFTFVLIIWGKQAKRICILENVDVCQVLGAHA
jgi:hypothetical protein